MAVAADGPQTHPTWGLPLFVIIIGSFMSILDSSIVNVAIPRLMTEFGASTDQVQWVVTIYLLALGVVVPVSGWLADRYGMSRVYQRASASFGLAVLTSVFTRRLAERSATLAANVTYFNPALAVLARHLATAAGQATHVAVVRSAQATAFLAVGQLIGARAYAGAVDDVFLYAALSSAVGVLLAFFVRERRRPRDARTPSAVE